jgi:hypothetical protein
MKTKITLFVSATLASLFLFGGCSSIPGEPNYDNPIVAALETKKHKEERLAKEKVEAEKRAREAEKRRAEYEAQRKGEEKAKNEKLAAALRDPEISKWRSHRDGAYSVAFGIVKRFEEKKLYNAAFDVPSLSESAAATAAKAANQSERYMNAYKWLILALMAAQNDNERNSILLMGDKLKPWVTETSHQLEVNNHRNQLGGLASQFNGKPWKDFCDYIIKNGLLPPKP